MAQSQQEMGAITFVEGIRRQLISNCSAADVREIAAGAIPRLVQLLGPSSHQARQDAATATLWLLCELAGYQVHTQVAHSGAVPRLLQLLDSDASDSAKEAAANVLRLVCRGASPQSYVVSAAVPALTRQHGSSSSSAVRRAAGDALESMTPSPARSGSSARSGSPAAGQGMPQPTLDSFETRLAQVGAVVALAAIGVICVTVLVGRPN